MKHRNKYHPVLLAALILVACTSAASAEVDLRFDPAETTIAPGDIIRMSVMLDDPIWFRTIELTVTYDPTIIGSVSGGMGLLFSEAVSNNDFFVLESFEDDEPGQWHGWAIVMGATDSLSGPGELFHWQVEGLVEGTSPITSIETFLYEPNALVIPDVTLDPTTLRVRIPPSGVHDLPGLRTGLNLYPNPFNPSTRIGFDLPTSGRILLSVFDSRGRLIRTLHDGQAGAGPLQFDWDGRDDGGLVQPGGVYLFRLETSAEDASGITTTKGLLLK